MEVYLKLKKALQGLNGEPSNEPVPPLAQPPKTPTVNTDDMIYNRNENPWQDNPHHGNFPPGFMFGSDRRGGLFSEIDKEFEELDRFMQNSRHIFDEIDQTRMGFGQMFKELSDIEQNMQSTSQSVRIQIRTNEEGELEEHRTVTTIGPDGVPHEDVSVRTLSGGSPEDNSIVHGSNLGGPIDPFQLLFGQIPGNQIPLLGNDPRGHSNYSPEERNRNMFLRNEPPQIEPTKPKPENVEKQVYDPKKFQAFEIPDYAKQMRDSLDKIIRP